MSSPNVQQPMNHRNNAQTSARNARVAVSPNRSAFAFFFYFAGSIQGVSALHERERQA